MLFMQVNYTFSTSIMNGFFGFPLKEGFPTQDRATHNSCYYGCSEAGFALAFVMLVFL
jgi:hypothetical protein